MDLTRSPVSSLRKTLFWLCFGLIVAFGALLRFQAVEQSVVIAPVRADAAEYLSSAYNLKYFGVYSSSTAALAGNPNPDLVPDLRRSPGYPLFLLPLIDRTLPEGARVPENSRRIGYAQAGLSIAVMVMVMVLFRPLLSGYGALAVGLLTACSPHLVNANIYLLTESLFCFLLVAATLLLGRLGGRGGGWVALLLGALLAFATLTRPWLQYFVVVLGLFLWLTRARTERRVLVIALATGFLLVLSPWYLRNLLTLGPQEGTSVLAFSLLHGSYPDLMYRGDPASFGFPYRFDPLVPGVEKGVGSVLSYLWERAREEPAAYLAWFFGKKQAMLFSWGIVQGMGDAFIYPVQSSPYFSVLHFQLSRIVMHAAHPFIQLLALLGTLLVWLPSVARALDARFLDLFRMLALLLLYFVAVHTLLAPLPRYTIPLQPILYGMAVASVVMLISTLRHRSDIP